MIRSTLKKIRSLAAERKSRSVAQGAPSQQFASDAERIKATGEFTLDEVDLVVQAISQHDIVYGSPWDNFRMANLRLPSWFKMGLNPHSEEYATQQYKLWSELTRHHRPYAPEIDEREAPLANVDAVKRPAYYMRRDAESVRLAADQIIATGMILKHSGVRPGSRALEYGAGFGQTALALARLGVEVDTVDISKAFCEYVRDQADFFQVPLTPFEGRFGWNPRGDQKYDLIFFYEAFHHCADFRSVVRDLKRHLAPDGRVLLVGEPISRLQNRYLPYPWGLRLDAEPIAQVRRYGWLELGFTEEFLLRLFLDSGFTAERIDCAASVHGSGYIFRPRGETIYPSQQWFPDDINSGWNNPEEHGRWTKAEARVLLDTSDTFQKLEIDAQNHHPFMQPVEFRYGNWITAVRFRSGERKSIVIDAVHKAPYLTISTSPLIPAQDYIFRGRDTRSLGILIRSVTYKD
jgi:2-polyprenyl-3-methyl-5-hydroxy-6-metoxy-1,4-benzoquinol methylase